MKLTETERAAVEYIHEKAVRNLAILGHPDTELAVVPNRRLRRTIMQARSMRTGWTQSKNGQTIRRCFALEIRFSPNTWQRMTPSERDQIIAHESAHLADYLDRGTSAHDLTWKSKMVRLGYSLRDARSTIALRDTRRQQAAKRAVDRTLELGGSFEKAMNAAREAEQTFDKAEPEG